MVSLCWFAGKNVSQPHLQNICTPTLSNNSKVKDIWWKYINLQFAYMLKHYNRRMGTLFYKRYVCWWCWAVPYVRTHFIIFIYFLLLAITLATLVITCNVYIRCTMYKNLLNIRCKISIENKKYKYFVVGSKQIYNKHSLAKPQVNNNS